MDEELKKLQAELKSYFEKAAEEQKKFGTISDGLKSKIEALQTQVDAIDKKLAGGAPGGGGEDEETFESIFREDASVKQLIQDKRGRAVVHFKTAHPFERKTTITGGTGGTVSTATTGVLQIQRLPGITQEPRQELTIRDLLTANPTTFQVVDFVKVSQPMSPASPVPEASLKPENQLNFTSLSERVRTIATWIPASRQILDDMDELMGFIRTSMPYYVNLAEEQQLLTGDATGENLHGLIPQATPFNAGLLHGSWNKIDVIGRAISQIVAAKELNPTFVVMHPNDWWDVRLTKDQYGRYLLGDPGGQQAYANIAFGSIKPVPNLFDLSVVPTTNMAPGTFLVGTGNPVATEIRDRMEMQVDISTEHQDFFIRNLVAVRAEKRLVLITRRPGSFVTGTFTTSP